MLAIYESEKTFAIIVVGGNAMRYSKYDFTHENVLAARKRVQCIIDAVSPNDLVKIVKETPSLRGMIAGNIAELMFRKHLEASGKYSDFYKPDDHDREENKVDLRFAYKGRKVNVQLKSIQTNSIKWNVEEDVLECGVQNDGSDKRAIELPNGHRIETTNYKFGDYDILAVPLFPFTGKWNFAYLLNEDCAHSTSKKYSEADRKYLISTMERLTYPIPSCWTDDLEVAIKELYKRRGISL